MQLQLQLQPQVQAHAVAVTSTSHHLGLQSAFKTHYFIAYPNSTCSIVFAWSHKGSYCQCDRYFRIWTSSSPIWSRYIIAFCPLSHCTGFYIHISLLRVLLFISLLFLLSPMFFFVFIFLLSLQVAFWSDRSLLAVWTVTSPIYRTRSFMERALRELVLRLSFRQTPNSIFRFPRLLVFWLG